MRYNALAWMLVSRFRRVLYPALLVAASFLATAPQHAAVAGSMVEAACGGSRASATAVWEDASGTIYSDTLYGGAFGEVGVASAGDTTVNGEWFSTMLFGNIPAPGVGDVIMRYQPNTSNVLSATSNSATGTPFFPATVTMSLNYQLDVLNASGNIVTSLATQTPATLQGVVNSIPPIGTLFTFQNDLEFFDVSGAALLPTLTLRTTGTAGFVGDPGGLNVTLANSSADLDSGTFSTAWVITNEGAPTTINWFVAPIRDVQILTQDLAMDVPLSDTIRVTVSGTFGPGTTRPGLVFHAVSAPGMPNAEAHLVEYFDPISVPASSPIVLLTLVVVLASAAFYFFISEDTKPQVRGT